MRLRRPALGLSGIPGEQRIIEDEAFARAQRDAPRLRCDGIVPAHAKGEGLHKPRAIRRRHRDGDLVIARRSGRQRQADPPGRAFGQRDRGGEGARVDLQTRCGDSQRDVACRSRGMGQIEGKARRIPRRQEAGQRCLQNDRIPHENLGLAHHSRIGPGQRHQPHFPVEGGQIQRDARLSGLVER